LNSWIGYKQRQPAPFPTFSVIDVSEHQPPDALVKADLAELLREERFDSRFVVAMARHLGRDDVEQMVRAGLAHGQTARKGDFGEVLLGALLETFHGYAIPVRKMRSRVSSDQSQPRIDVVGLKVADGRLTEVCLGESKLRTKADTGAAVAAHDQLMKERVEALPDILVYVANRLFELQSPLFESFAAYLGDRADTRQMESCAIGLTWDATQWSEQVLTNLQDRGVELPSLSVHVTSVQALDNLVYEVFVLAGLQTSADED